MKKSELNCSLSASVSCRQRRVRKLKRPNVFLPMQELRWHILKKTTTQQKFTKPQHVLMSQFHFKIKKIHQNEFLKTS